MPTCERRRPAAPARGFTYVALLFMLVLAGAALAALGTHWQQQARREREAELLFRGLQLREALLRYAAATPPGAPRAPQRLDELLVDRRHQPPRHHLRRLWADPFTGQADWVLLRDARGGIVGLHSRLRQPALRRDGLPAALPPPTASTPLLSDWRFGADGAAGAAAATDNKPMRDSR